MRLPIWTGAIFAALLARPAVADVPWSTDWEAYNAGALGDAPNQTFRSSPIVAPVFQVSTLDAEGTDPAPYLFLDWGHEGVGSPMIFRADDLSLVYADQQYERVKNTRAQTIRGEKYLMFWEGVEEVRYGRGRCLAFDEEYNLAHNVTPVGLASGALADLHECQVTDDDTVLITIYESVPWDLTPVGGPADGTLLDCLFQEINPRTNELVFEWRASEHYSVADTSSTIEHDTLPGGYGGDYLSSASNHVILIDGSDGSTIWTLGGAENDFEDLSGGGGATTLSLPHQPRFRGDKSRITLIDNGPERVNAVGCSANCSRGLEVRLDYDGMTAEVVREYFHPMGLKTTAQGGYASLESGNALIAWGTQPGVTEHKRDVLVMDIQFGRIVDEYNPEWNAVYRAFKMDWRGRPQWDPSLAVEDGTVYVSWNGATELAGWVVLGSDRADDIDGRNKVLAKSPRRGFETAIPLVPSWIPRYIRAAATDSKGRTIGYTPVWDSSMGDTGSADERYM